MNSAQDADRESTERITSFRKERAKQMAEKKKGQMYMETEAYVNEVCRAFLAPHSEFISIECKHKGSEGECYIRVVDAADNVRLFNATGMNLEEVCEMVVKIIIGDHIPREVVDRDKRKEASVLFR